MYKDNLKCPVCKEYFDVPYHMEIVCPNCSASLYIDYYTDEDFEEYPVLLEDKSE